MVEHRLAAAVSNAGGLGLVGAASAPPEVVREEIKKSKELTDKPFGVNIMLLNPNAEEIARIIVEEGEKVVTAGADFMELEKLTLGSLRSAVMDGDVVNGTVMTGQIAGLIKSEGRRCHDSGSWHGCSIGG